MPKSPRGSFSYVEISMYKPFNSSSSTTPTSPTAHSQGYRASTHETHEPQFSNPAFSPTVHVPQSILNSSSNNDDGYRSSIDELPSHMTNQAFEYRPQHEQLRQPQRHPSVESAQNIHQQPRQHHLQHGLQYSNFNQQRDHNNEFVDHSDTMNRFEQQLQNGGQQQLHLAQASSQPPSGPPIQLVNGMHPARLALLQTPEELETPPPVPKKKSKAEKGNPPPHQLFTPSKCLATIINPSSITRSFNICTHSQRSPSNREQVARHLQRCCLILLSPRSTCHRYPSTCCRETKRPETKRPETKRPEIKAGGAGSRQSWLQD